MKKKMTLMMAGVLAVGILATGCGNKNAETTADTAAETTTEATGESKVDGETAAAAGERTTFTVGFDASFPPYGYQENGEYVGFDLDLAQEVCDRNGWEGYGIEFWSHRLYLERIYHQRT